jgi:hypothetical protein
LVEGVVERTQTLVFPVDAVVGVASISQEEQASRGLMVRGATYIQAAVGAVLGLLAPLEALQDFQHTVDQVEVVQQFHSLGGFLLLFFGVEVAAVGAETMEQQRPMVEVADTA